MDDSFFDIPVELKNDFDRKIASAFSVYDHGRNLMIEALDVGQIIRSLGCVPSEEEINKIIKSTEFESCEGKIHLSRFLPHVKELLNAKKMMPATSYEIIEAFKILDPKGRGYLYKDELMTFLKDFGESICDDHLNEMLNAAIDPITNRIDYETYTVQLAHEPNDDENIYEIAEKFKKNKPVKGRK